MSVLLFVVYQLAVSKVEPEVPELKEQIDKGEIPAPAVVFCPLGSGGTLAGLSLGFALAGLQTRAVGVRVSESHLGPFQACTERTVEKLMNKTYGYLKKRNRRLPDLTVKKPSIVENYFGGGYGVPTQAGSTVCRLVEKKEGMFLIWGSAVLDDRMQYAKIGDKIRITFDGKTKNKRNQDVNLFTVEVATGSQGEGKADIEDNDYGSGRLEKIEDVAKVEF